MPRKLLLPTVTLSATLAVLAGSHGWAGAEQSSPSAGTSAALQQVTVAAKRLNLAPKVRKFVNQIAARENGYEGLARWQSRLCPLVLGFPPAQAEWIRKRIVTVALEAKVPFRSDPHCRPNNLFIFANDNPKGLLQEWDDRNSARAGVFGDATSFVIKEFIAAPRAVRVWYNAGMQTASGLGLSGSVNYGSMYGSTGGTPWIQQTPLDASHIRSNVIYTFSSVFVIADATRLRGVTLGQFADYIAMVALADIEPGAHPGDAPTILKLFDGPPQSAPAGMTDWDLAFLKSLYATDQSSKLQRRLIQRAMMRQIVH